MKRLFFALTCYCALLLPLPAHAIELTSIHVTGMPTAPKSVLFYPNEVQLTVQEKATPQRLPDGTWGVSFLVPQNADKLSFFAYQNSNPVSGFFWLEDIMPEATFASFMQRPMLPEQEAIPERKGLLQAIVTIQNEIAKVQGTMTSIERQLAVWSPPSTPNVTTPVLPMSVEEREKLTAHIATQVPLLQENYNKTMLLQMDLTRQLQAAQASLADYDDLHALTLVFIPVDETVKNQVSFTYGYITPASGTSQYIVQAAPKDKKVVVEQFAVLQQTSGQEWKDVDVMMSTSYRSQSLTPRNLPHWSVFFQKDYMSSKMRGAVADTAMPAPMAMEAAEMRPESKSAVKRPAPVQMEATGFRLWKLGKQDLQHNSPNRIMLVAEQFDADFYYLLRPANTPKGILVASLTVPKAIEMPKGKAQYFMDSVAIGNSTFECIGTEKEVFFGEDPLVTAQMRDLLYSKGNTGFISKQQTVTWDWEITALNEHSWPVKVFIEDQKPNVIDEDISIQVTSDPQPEVIAAAPKTNEASKYRWAATLEAGKSFVIKHKVMLSAPIDKNLNVGRGTK